MLPNFNPDLVSSEPGQDLESVGRQLMFSSRRTGDVSEEDIEDTTPLGMVEDARAPDIEGGSDVDDPDQV